MIYLGPIQTPPVSVYELENLSGDMHRDRGWRWGRRTRSEKTSLRNKHFPKSYFSKLYFFKLYFSKLYFSKLYFCQIQFFPTVFFVTQDLDNSEKILYNANLTTRIPNSLFILVRPSQNPHGDISGTKRGIIDPLVSKQPKKKNSEKNWEKYQTQKFQQKLTKNIFKRQHKLNQNKSRKKLYKKIQN